MAYLWALPSTLFLQAWQFIASAIHIKNARRINWVHSDDRGGIPLAKAHS